jgi:predicted NAD/FAD-binding protein
MRVAIVGSGITGLAAARALAGRHEITIFEAAERPGGHVYTVDTPHGPVDMGFIVHNRDNYPRFCAMLDELGVATRPTTMSFSVAHDGLEWGSATLGDVFAQRRRLVDPRHWRFVLEVLALLRRARRDVGTLGDESLDDYLARTRVSREVRERFVVPLAAALWSLAPAHCGEFPAVSYFRFLDQHGMLSPVRPLPWRTIVGGSRVYVDALLAHLGRLRVDLRLGTRVERIERRAGAVTSHGGPGAMTSHGGPGAVTIVRDGRAERFDRAIVATHADTALALLAEPTEQERRVLGAFRYSSNRTVLHTDRSFLPARVHASWNYVADPDTSRVAVTYSMTKLQGLPDAPYLVTLNPRTRPRNVLHEVTFAHPQLDRAALAAQREVPRLPGPVAFAGAHLGFGFHEDGMRTGEQAAARIEAHARVRGMNVRSAIVLAEAE